MRPAPGSFLWLLANDMRLNWRRFASMLGAVGELRPWLLVGVAVVLSHALAVPVARWLAPRMELAGSQVAQIGILAGVMVSLFCWMVAQSMFGTMRAVYDRGDLDLLMGSPLPARRVFAAKSCGVLASTLGSLGVLALPLANAGALCGNPEWLALYPTLLALGLIATAIALLTAIGLFFLMGARRARVVMQLAAAAIGGGFVLCAQIVILLPEAIQKRVLETLAAAGAPGSLPARILTMPVAATLGDPKAIALLLAIGVTLFVAAVVVLAERFAAASLAAAGAASPAVKAKSVRATRFRSGPSASLHRKEWRLMARDPGLFAQISLQIVYTIPLVIVLLKSGTLPIGVAVAPSLVVIAAQIAASLAWITVSGEDAPELIASAPVAPNAVDRAKLTAIAAPVALLMALPVVALAAISWAAATVAVFMTAGACVSTALLNLWHPMPGNRRGMLRRHSQSKLLALIEHIVAVLWAVGTVLALLGTVWFVAPLVLATLILLGSRPAAMAYVGRRLRIAAPRMTPPVDAASPGV